ncbi:MAG: 4Fe-4S dicluster domain-containing protein [Gemmatimonas sp.]
MQKWNLIVDVENCTNCNMCVLANADEYVGNDWPGYAAAMPKHGHRWIDIKRRERGQGAMVDVAYVPTMCQHCDDAPCLKAATNGAVTKRPDGIVLIDPVKAKGQKQIVDACPFGAVWWNEEKQIPQAWTFDAHLLDQGWKEPRAAQSCPTGAIAAVKAEDADMERMVRDQQLSELEPEAKTKPRVWYRNLYRYTHAFVGGTIAKEVDGISDCVAGATVTLLKDGRSVGTAVSDAFGDFKIDRVPMNSGAYRLDIAAPNGKRASVEVVVTESVYVGCIMV